MIQPRASKQLLKRLLQNDVGNCKMHITESKISKKAKNPSQVASGQLTWDGHDSLNADKVSSSAKMIRKTTKTFMHK